MAKEKARAAGKKTIPPSDEMLFAFDDPLASVDVHVGKELFQCAFVDILRGQTRIMALSSNYQFLPYFDRIIVMDAGRIVLDGPYSVIANKFFQYSTPGSDTWTSASALRDQLYPEGRTSASFLSENQRKIEEKRFPTKSESLMTIEDRERGAVSLATYIKYFAAAGGSTASGKGTYAFILFLFAITQVCRVFCDIWAGTWATDRAKTNSMHSEEFYRQWYYILVASLSTLTVIRAVMFIRSCLAASRNMHTTFLGKIFMAPINLYFDVTPLGRIINRFSKDLDSIDSLLPDFFLNNLQNLFQCLAIIAVCVASTPYFIIVMVPLSYIFFKIQVITAILNLIPHFSFNFSGGLC